MPRYMNLKDPILITGCARSGTSLVAAIIHEAGASGGDITVTPGSPYNPTGFYENHRLISAIDKPLLVNAGFDPLGQKGLSPADLPAVDIRESVFRIAADQGIHPGEQWFFKDAKLLLVYRSYVESFPESKIILVRRNANDIVKSCMRTPFMHRRDTPEQWLDWVEDHEKLMVALHAAKKEVREVWYEDLMSGNLNPIREAIEWLGLEYHVDFVSSIIIRKK